MAPIWLDPNMELYPIEFSLVKQPKQHSNFLVYIFLVFDNIRTRVSYVDLNDLWSRSVLPWRMHKTKDVYNRIFNKNIYFHNYQVSIWCRTCSSHLFLLLCNCQSKKGENIFRVRTTFCFLKPTNLYNILLYKK